jgi:hypothetical protein
LAFDASRAKHDTVSEVRQIKAQLPDIKADMEALAVSSTAMGVGLRELQVGGREVQGRGACGITLSKAHANPCWAGMAG